VAPVRRRWRTDVTHSHIGFTVISHHAGRLKAQEPNAIGEEPPP
jgi:hypothetical protein